MSENRIMPYSMLDPCDILNLYYTSLYGGDLGTVKELMTEESYTMTLETFGLRLSLRDTEFKAQLKNMEADEEALAEVENKLSHELISRRISPTIDIKSTSLNGSKRQTMNYTEDGKDKKLYFSKEDNGWKINYYAGRKID